MGSMKFLKVFLLVIACCGLSCAAAAGVRAAAPPATQPVKTDPAGLQLRANEAMARGEYAKALPMLIEVSKAMTDQPDNLGSILEQIRVCKRQLANPLQPPMPKIDLGSGRKPHEVPAKGQTLNIAIKELGNFDYDSDKGGGIPDDVTALDGAHIRTNGYMIPLDQAERINRFAMVPSLFSCCYGQPPQVQHTIVCQTPAEKALEYTPDAIVVEGTLRVHEERDHGFIVSIFQLEVSSVKLADNP